MREKKGFTLIELLVVISIISVLAALLMANFIGIRQRGRDGQRKADLSQLQSALEFYRSDIQSYPTSASLSSCGGALTVGSTNYINVIPCDPTTETAYSYIAAPSGCDGSTTVCTSYTLYGCLENVNDSQKDATTKTSPLNCATLTGASFTPKSP